MTPSEEAVERILSAYKDKDYFRILGLEYPDVDALGRPVWHVTPSEVSRAYRRLSILVHPDRNSGEDAREAFEALKESHARLKDPGQIDTILKDNVERAVRKREREMAAGGLYERVERMSRQQEEEQRLRQEDSLSLNEEIVRQMRERQERQALKKERRMKRERAIDTVMDTHACIQEDKQEEERRRDTMKRRDDDDTDDDLDEEAMRTKRRKAMANRRRRTKNKEK